MKQTIEEIESRGIAAARSGDMPSYLKACDDMLAAKASLRKVKSPSRKRKSKKAKLIKGEFHGRVGMKECSACSFIFPINKLTPMCTLFLCEKCLTDTDRIKI